MREIIRKVRKDLSQKGRESSNVNEQDTMIRAAGRIDSIQLTRRMVERVQEAVKRIEEA